jgi:hypothetical protein
MELEESASAEEIYPRIVRRGSFVFVSPESAVAAVGQELDRMASDGEAHVFDLALRFDS